MNEKPAITPEILLFTLRGRIGFTLCSLICAHPYKMGAIAWLGSLALVQYGAHYG